MSLPADDADNRARSIFERLRAEQESEGAGDGDTQAGPQERSGEEEQRPPDAGSPPPHAHEGESPDHQPDPAFDAEADGEQALHPAEDAPNSSAAPAAAVAAGAIQPTPAGPPPAEPPSTEPAPDVMDDGGPSSPDGPGPELSPLPTAPPPVPHSIPPDLPASEEPSPPPVEGNAEAPSSAPSWEDRDEFPGQEGGPAATAVAPAPPDDALAPVDPEGGEPEPRPLPGEAALPQLSPHPPDAPARPARPLPRIIAVANQKGGVGKTTTAVNLGASLAELGHRVLVVDLDPQGNATTGLGINSRNLERSIYDVILHDTPIEDCIEPTALRNLFVAPATIDLAGAEIELVPAFSRELRLRRALERTEGDFDFTLIDCPPSLGLLTINGLAAADEVLVPIQCEYYALEGLGQLLRNVTLVQGNLNPRLEVSNIVLTMYDARTRLAEQVAQEVRDHFGTTVCRNVVPRTVRLSEAPSFGQPIIVFDPSSRGSIAYRELAKEVVGGTS